MSRQETSTVGAFAQAAITELGVGKLLHIAGITSGEQAPYDIEAQAEIIFQRIQSLLAREGGSLAHLVKINAYIVDMREYEQYNAVRNRYFKDLPQLPASATIGCNELLRPLNRIEIDGVAYIPHTAL